MNEILTINYESENPTVSARELHEKLHIGTKFTTWFERMKEYGFSEGKEFFPKLGETSEQGGRPQTDFEISVDMAKQICMLNSAKRGTTFDTTQYKWVQEDIEKLTKEIEVAEFGLGK